MSTEFSGKTVKFSEKDKKLVDRITKYQKEKGMDHFVSAVRSLCEDALDIKRIVR